MTRSWIFLTVVEHLASLKLTLFAIVLLVVCAFWASYSELPSTWIVSGPIALLTLNLTAAVIANPTFRRQTPLLVFHLSLVALVLLVALGRLMYLRGHVEVTEGTEFNAAMAGVEKGPWHIYKLDEVRFVNDGFTIEYRPGVVRGKTYNKVVYPGPDGERLEKVIGDQTPLVIKGYRFYTTFNKGFAPIFTWIPADGSPPVTGSAHLPSYPANEKAQAVPWKTPDSDIEILTMLRFEEKILDPDEMSMFRKPKKHHVFVTAEGEAKKMRPGDRLELPEGTLVYRELRTWMGYSIYNDWTMPWLIASCLLAAGSAGWYFWEKFSATPWMKNKEEDSAVGA